MSPRQGEPGFGEAEPSPPASGAASARRPAPEVPRFARYYPKDARLDDLVTAFCAGDYRRVRREAPELAARASDPDIAKAARDLRARLDPDPLAIGVVVAAALLILFLSVWAYTHRVF